MMAYPYFTYPAFQQGYQQPMYQQTTPQPAQDNRIFVQNKTAADAYLMAPNSFVRLWDSGRNVFYEKRSDNMGRPAMEAFEYRRITQDTASFTQDSTAGGNSYDERIKTLESRISALERGMNESDADNAGVHEVSK